MTTTPTSPTASQQAAVDAALRILGRMGLSPDDLTAASRQRLPVPTFADYVPVVSAAVTDGTRRADGTYWNRITEQRGARHLDEPTPSEVRQFMKLVKANAVQRRNGRGGRSAEEHLVAGGCNCQGGDRRSRLATGSAPSALSDRRGALALSLTRHAPGQDTYAYISATDVGLVTPAVERVAGQVV